MFEYVDIVTQLSCCGQREFEEEFHFVPPVQSNPCSAITTNLTRLLLSAITTLACKYVKLLLVIAEMYYLVSHCIHTYNKE